MDFVHLHVHSDFSILDGAASIPRLVQKAAACSMTHLALTDHGSMFGAVEFFLACKDSPVRPIIGAELYVAEGSRFDRTGEQRGNAHLVLLAADEEGYRNLLTLASAAYTEGFYYKPRIDDELLASHSRGLIGLSSCIMGRVPRLVVEGREDEARRMALHYNEIFGQGSFFLELQDHGIAEQRTANRGLVEISQATGIPLVATNDIHYIERDDARAQDVLLCIGTNKKISDEKRLKFQYPEFYFKTQEEMARLFGEVPDALRNTVEIARRCTLDLPQPGPELPDYDVPEGHTRESYLVALAEQGVRRRYEAVTDEITERLRYELGVINSMRFTGYCLIVWDFIRFAREQEIPVGPGRGSGPGSLVAYALQITDIDPFRYGLLFERFLNPERVSMPDFDIDFCYERRGEVIDYVTKKYGSDRVAQIITFGTLGARAVIRDVARVLDIPYGEADRIAKLVPSGPKVTLEQALAAEPEFAVIRESGPQYAELLDISLRLEGLRRHPSTHAAGIVIGNRQLTKYVPLYRDAKTGSIATQFTWELLEDCGLVKMDFLGLKTLTLLKNTQDLIRNTHPDFDIARIPEDDASTFEMLSQGRSTCVFQFESSGMQGVLRQARPTRIEDLIALNALYRPGPMENIPQFIESKHDPSKTSYPLPELEPVLAETYGVIVYQEQVLQIARTVAGYSLGQADILRKAMGKKKPEVMVKEKKRFVAGAVDRGCPATTAEGIFDLLIPFAGYGFNKAHATSYAVLAYQTAYLKSNYPAEFMAANLTNEMRDTDKLSSYIQEARGMGLEILPPDVNLSDRHFAVREGRIVYGLLGIKNVGSSAVDEIVSEREKNGPYQGFVEFLERVDARMVNRKVLETLVLCGAFDSMGHGRATLADNLDRLNGAVAASKESTRYGQATLFDAMDAPAVQMVAADEWPRDKMLSDEKQNLGFYFSGHPLDEYREIIERHATLTTTRLESASAGKQYVLIGLVRGVREILTRKGQRMAFLEIEDMDGSAEVVVFSAVYEQAAELLEVDRAVAVMGKIDVSRGDPKLLADEIVEPGEIKKRRVSAVHARIDGEYLPEESLVELRDFLIDRPGNCMLYLHIASTTNGEIVIRASPQIGIAADDEVLAGIRSCTSQVVDVWRQ